MASLTERATRGLMTLVAAQIWIMASSYVIAVLLARSLGPETYGVYGIVYSVLLSVELIGRLGLPQAVSILVAGSGGSARRVEATGFTLALLVYTAIFLAFFLAAPALAAAFNVADGTLLFRIAALDIPFYGLYFMAVHVINGRRRFAQEAVASSVYMLTKTIGILGLVAIGPSVQGALIVNAVGSIIALGLVVHLIGRESLRLTFEEAGPIIRLGIPVAVIALGTQGLISVDLWILNALGSHLDAAEKGFYVAASNIARIPNAIAFVATSVLVPSIIHALSCHDRKQAVATVERTIQFMAITLLPGCALIAIEAEEILTLIFSKDYAAGAPLLTILAFAQGLCFTVFMAFSNLLVAAGRKYASAAVATAMLCLAAVVAVVGIQVWGARGAALGALVGNGIAAAIVTVLVIRTLEPHLDLVMFGKLAAATALVCLAAAAIETRGLLLLVELLVLASGFLALLVLLRVISLAHADPFLPPFLKRCIPNRSASVGAE
jgi:O-antigen/teichoic acid export membrane protein